MLIVWAANPFKCRTININEGVCNLYVILLPSNTPIALVLVKTLDLHGSCFIRATLLAFPWRGFFFPRMLLLDEWILCTIICAAVITVMRALVLTDMAKLRSQKKKWCLLSSLPSRRLRIRHLCISLLALLKVISELLAWGSATLRKTESGQHPFYQT